MLVDTVLNDESFPDGTHVDQVDMLAPKEGKVVYAWLCPGGFICKLDSGKVGFLPEK